LENEKMTHPHPTPPEPLCDKIATQFDSFERFFSKSEPLPEFCFQRIVEANRTIPLEQGHTLTVGDWRLDPPQMDPQDCIQLNATYARALWLSFSVTGPRFGSDPEPFWKRMCDMPAPTPAGEFILHSLKAKRANRYVMIMQLAKAPGLYYREKPRRNRLPLRICEIRPVLGRPILLLDKQGTGEAALSGIKMELGTLSALLHGNGLSIGHDLLTRIYRFLRGLNLVSGEEAILPLDLATADLDFVKGRFREYILGLNFSLLGKRQLKSQLGDPINTADPILNASEWDHILRRFQTCDLSVTDDRSLKNRKVRLVGDFLWELFQTAFSELRYQTRSNFQSWLADTPVASPMGSDGSPGLLTDLEQVVSRAAFDRAATVIRGHQLMQLLDDTNPLSELSQKRRLTFRGPNGIPENTLYLEKRDVHPTDFGRICPVETPQGENLGFNLYLAKEARIDASGLIQVQLRHRETGKIVWLDPYEEEEKVEAAMPAPDSLSLPTDTFVPARTRDTESSLQKAAAVPYEYASPDGFLGYAASLIPFIQHDDANRALMGSGMMKQALPLLHPEPPYVVSGAESAFAEPHPGPSPFFVNGQLCLGRNLLVGYLPWDLLNYEDGIVISDRLVREDRLTHVETEERVIDEQRFRSYGKRFQEITRDNPHLTEDQIEPLDEFGVVREGTLVKPGDVLVSRIRIERDTMGDPAGDRHSDLATRLLCAANLSGAEATEDASVYAPKSFDGRVTSVRWAYSESSKGMLWRETDGTPPENASPKTCAFPPGVLRRVIIRLESTHPVQMGDKLTGRHGNKGVIAAILPERAMPYIKQADGQCSDPDCPIFEPHQHLEILLNPLTITSRKNLGQLYETALGWAAAHSTHGRPLKAGPFSLDWSWDRIAEQLKALNLQDKQAVYFQEDGTEIRMDQPVAVGYQYFLKLRQLAAKKIRARSTFAYGPSMDQPSVPHHDDPWQQEGVRSRSAQRSGEMEVWALEGHGARSILDEFLFLKSDDAHLRQRLQHYARVQEQYAKRAWERFIQGLRDQGIDINSDTDTDSLFKLESGADGLLVSCPEGDVPKLVSVAADTGFRLQDRGGGQFGLILAPLSQFAREPRPFKNFIHYCRALGMEIEGVKDGPKHIPLAGPEIPAWPSLEGVRARIATDADRKKWANNKVVSLVGTERQGLWSNDIFGNTGNPKDKDWTRDAAGIIELPVPIDLPLFRSVIEDLLDVEGFALDDLVDPIRQVLFEMLKDASEAEIDEIWQTARTELSPLQTLDSLLAWLEGLGEGANPVSRSDLAALLEKHLPKDRMFNLKCALDPWIDPRIDRHLRQLLSYLPLPARGLYRHFERMDLTRIREQANGHSRQQRAAAILLENVYQPTDLFMRNLLVLPKMLRYEKNRVFHPKEPQPRIEKDLSYEHPFNLFYVKILRQNHRIRTLMERKAPEPMLVAEEEKLRRRVYGLLVNGAMKDVLPEPFPLRFGDERYLRSIYIALKGETSGKEGIFRRHLLGKRVDFSSRAVIVPDPSLGLDEVGLPLEAGLELFRDLLIRHISKGPDQTTRDAISFIRDPANRATVAGLLRTVSARHPVLLNRAPSLHRLSILAFYPRFHDQGAVIQLNPYVCEPFNADFDGDTMAAFLPILPDSLAEARNMLPSRALRSPGHGRLVIGHKGDLALALHLLAKEDADGKRAAAEILGLTENRGAWDAEAFAAALDRLHQKGPDHLAAALKRITPLFQKALNRSGVSLSIDDFRLMPSIRETVFQKPREFLQNGGSLETKEGRRLWDRVIQDIKDRLDKKVADLRSDSPLKALFTSKAAKVEWMQLSGMRGFMLRPGGTTLPYPVASNIVDGMPPLDYFVSCHGSRYGLADKGLMTGPAGDLTNILVQAVQGETIVEDDCKTAHGIFLSAFDHAGASPMTLGQRAIGRSLAEDIDLDGERISAGTIVARDLADRIERSDLKWLKVRSPITCEGLDTHSPRWRQFVQEARGSFLTRPVQGTDLRLDMPLTEEDLMRMARLGVSTIEIQKPETENSIEIPVPDVRGICKKCYGLDAATGDLPPLGFPAGVVAAHSIGEPGTQLTLRTFHTGGVVGQEISQGLLLARRAFSMGLVREGVTSPITGHAQVVKTPNAMYWLEVEGMAPDGRAGCQRLPVVEQDPVAGWDETMEGLLMDQGTGAMVETPRAEGSVTLQIGESGPACRVVTRLGHRFDVSQGQRVFRPGRDLDAQEVDLKAVSRKYGPLAAAEYLLHGLQRIYRANAQVLDHHFEVALRSMFRSLQVIDAGTGPFTKGTAISIQAYLKLPGSQRPTAVPATLLQSAATPRGFLARLAFRDVRKHLVEAALHQEVDPLWGFKERVITGLIRNRREG